MLFLSFKLEEKGKAMAQSDENGYIFVGLVPLVYSRRNVERQQKIETWLDLYQLSEDLRIAKQQLKEANIPDYIR
jgi:hypothetical protein